MFSIKRAGKMGGTDEDGDGNEQKQEQYREERSSSNSTTLGALAEIYK